MKKKKRKRLAATIELTLDAIMAEFTHYKVESETAKELRERFGEGSELSRVATYTLEEPTTIRLPYKHLGFVRDRLRALLIAGSAPQRASIPMCSMPDLPKVPGYSSEIIIAKPAAGPTIFVDAKLAPHLSGRYEVVGPKR